MGLVWGIFGNMVPSLRELVFSTRFVLVGLLAMMWGVGQVVMYSRVSWPIVVKGVVTVAGGFGWYYSLPPAQSFFLLGFDGGS